MYERTPDYITQMHELCFDIQTFIAEQTLEQFLADKRTQNAVAMSLLALGEVANTLHQKDPEFIENYPQIPFKYMRGMRNMIAHGYFRLDFVVIFETATHSIPTLHNQLNQILTQLNKDTQ